MEWSRSVSGRTKKCTKNSLLIKSHFLSEAKKMEVENFWGVFNFQPPELKNHLLFIIIGGGLGKWRLKRDFFRVF
jgi:hypothetical protein